MYDLDKLIRNNNVTDECGLDLVYVLCQGKWNDSKTKILHKEVFSNPVYLGRLHKSAKAYNIGKEEDVLEVLHGFELFLRQPSNVRKLMQPLLDGSSFDDALSDLFSKDYLPDELLLRQKKTASVPKQVMIVIKKDMPEELVIKDYEGYEKLNRIIAKGDDHVTLQDLMGIVPESAAAVVKEEWHMKDGEDIASIFEHYCYHLAKKPCVFLEKMRKKVCKGQTLEYAVIRHFKRHYVEKGKELITKKNERTELMTDKNKRRLFFSLVGNDVRRERFFWIDQGKKSGKTISKEVKKVFCHLLYPDYFLASNVQGHFPDKETEKKVLSQIVVKEEKLMEDLRKHLEGEHGKSLIMNYFFNEDFQNWFQKLINQYVEAKARIDEFLKDEMTLRLYLSQKEEFWPTLNKLSNKFYTTGNVSYTEKGEKSKESKKSLKKGGKEMLVEDEVIDKVTEYFHEEVDYQGRRVHRYIKDFSGFHYEGSLSGWMNTTCYRFLSRYKAAMEAERKTKPFDPNSNSVKRFWKLLNDYEMELKTNKNAIRLEDCKISKRGKGLPKAQYLRNWLAKYGFNTIEEVLELLSPKGVFPYLDIVVNSALVDHAWKFFGFSKKNFEKVEKMQLSVKEMEARNDEWRFFDTSIINITADDIKDIGRLKKEQVRVLPRLVAFCHIIMERYYNDEGKKAVLRNEKTCYDQLGGFYGVDGSVIKTWHCRANKELKKRVSPLVLAFRDELENEIGSKLKHKTDEQQGRVAPILDKAIDDLLERIPIILYEISSLFNKGKERDSLQINCDSLDKQKLKYKDGRNLARYIAKKATSSLDSIIASLDSGYSDDEMPTLKDRDTYAAHMVNLVMFSLSGIKDMLVEKLKERK